MTITLIGDSLMDGWRGPGRALRAAYLPNSEVLAYPGRRPGDILAALRNTLTRIDTAIVMAGVNSFTLDAAPEGVARDVQALVQLVHSHASRVILCSILPAILWGRNEWPRIRETNRLLAHTEGVEWLDFAQAFLDGPRIAPRFTTDGVHLTTRGYEQWMQALGPSLNLAPRQSARVALALWRSDIRACVHRLIYFRQ